MEPIFAEHFWGDKNSGFDALQHSLKYACKTTNDFGEFIRDTMATEDVHHKMMIKLGRQINSYASASGTFGPCWLTIKELIDTNCASHVESNQCCANLMKDVQRYAEEQAKRHKEFKEGESTTLEVVNSFQSICQQLHKAEETYRIRYQECEKARRSEGATREKEKTQMRLKKAQTEYRHLVHRYNNARKEFVDRMRSSCAHFQEVEEKHLEQMRSFLKRYLGVIQNYAHSQLASIEKVDALLREERTTAVLLKMFAGEKGTGVREPRPIPMVEDWCLPGSDGRASAELPALLNDVSDTHVSLVRTNKDQSNRSTSVDYTQYQKAWKNGVEDYSHSSALPSNEPSCGTPSSSVSGSKRWESGAALSAIKKKMRRRADTHNSHLQNSCKASTLDDIPSTGSAVATVQDWRSHTPVERPVDEQGFSIPADDFSKKKDSSHHESSSDSDSVENDGFSAFAHVPKVVIRPHSVIGDVKEEAFASMKITAPPSKRRGNTCAQPTHEAPVGVNRQNSKFDKVQEGSFDLLLSDFENVPVTFNNEVHTIASPPSTMQSCFTEDTTVSNLGSVANSNMVDKDRTAQTADSKMLAELAKEGSATESKPFLPPRSKSKHMDPWGDYRFQQHGNTDSGKAQTEHRVWDLNKSDSVFGCSVKKEEINPPLPVRKSEPGRPIVQNSRLSINDKKSNLKVTDTPQNMPYSSFSPDTSFRKESHSEMDTLNSFVTIPRSPGSTLLQELIPIFVAFTETYHARFRGSDGHLEDRKIDGSLTVAFPIEIMTKYLTTGSLSPLSFTLLNPLGRIENVSENSKLIDSSIRQPNGFIHFTIGLYSLSEHLSCTKQRDPTSKFAQVELLKYNVPLEEVTSASAGPVSSVPVILRNFWDLSEPGIAEMRVDYEVNTVPPTNSNTSALLNYLARPDDLTFSVSFNPSDCIASMKSLPEGKFNEDKCRAQWFLKLGDSEGRDAQGSGPNQDGANPAHIASGSSGSIFSRYRLSDRNKTARKRPVCLRFLIEGYQISGVDFQLDQPTPYKLSLYRKRITTGRYVCDPDEDNAPFC